LYRNITGVASNSLTFSLDAYGRAVQLDPMNPALRVDVGSLYYATEDYDMAVRFYTDAVNLKPDYVNGYYNLAIALRRRGDLQNAQLITEQAVKLLQKDFSSKEYTNSPDLVKATKIRDFNTVAELLDQIKNEISTGDTPEVAGVKNTELPEINVPELQEAPNNTMAPAVEENPDAVLPKIAP
jgi:tetratricopeptide (TPR) repeat protein